MNPTLQIDNSEVKQFTDRLRKMHRSDLPIVVRQTLNDVAFRMKQRELLPAAKNVFTVRNQTFFKKYSAVKKAEGWEINTMNSEVGMTDGTQASKRLKEQETGGSLLHSTIYTDEARKGNKKSLVAKDYYLSNKDFVKGEFKKKWKPNNPSSRYVAAAFVSKREGKVMLMRNKKTNEGSMLLVTGITFGDNKVKHTGNLLNSTRTRDVKIEAVHLAQYKRDRKVILQPRRFVIPASINAAKLMEEMYRINAEKRLNK